MLPSVPPEPGEGPMKALSLAVSTARLNSHIRKQGLSSRELWTHRSQSTNKQIPVSDLHNILEAPATANQPPSQRDSQARPYITHTFGPHPTYPLQVGDLVYLCTDRDKSRARDRYIVVSIDGERCFIKTFVGTAQFRLSSYKVEMSECYRVPPNASHAQPSYPGADEYDDTSALDPPPTNQLPAPPALLPPHDDGAAEPQERFVSPTVDEDARTTSAPAIANPVSTSRDIHPVTRPQGTRKPPSYLKDYVLDLSPHFNQPNC